VEVVFLCTHLDAKRDPTQRLNQAGKIRELFPVAQDHRPILLAGDFNAQPGSTVLAVLLADWTDSAAGQQILTSPAGAPRAKIDYIFYRPAARWRVIESRAIDEKIASDHRPLLTVFELTRP
jgi:endonuclease/exonuclease/phosphatase (EEP) superfamily protein YafD